MAAEISPQTPLSGDVVSLVALYGALYGVAIVVGLVLLVLLVLRLTASSRGSAQPDSRAR